MTPSSPFGRALPSLVTAIPGPRSVALCDALADVECPALTARRARRREQTGAAHDPIVWDEAFEGNVRDVDGNVFVDMVSGFGAALVGHRHPRVVDAVERQSGRLLHALGDVYPSAAKIALEGRLASIAPWAGARVILGLSGSDAVEAALKTAVLATKRPGVLAFTGGYHGLSHGPLSVCGYSEAFRAPFRAQLNPAVSFAPYPAARRPDLCAAALEAARVSLASRDVGAVVIEPVLGRGGNVLGDVGTIDQIVAMAHAHGVVVIADEIYTGLRRIDGAWSFAAATWRVAPDVLCLGKALGGTLPVSACLMRPEIAAAWGDPGGEAIHTSTFLGNPLGCEAALATLDVLSEPGSLAALARTTYALRTRALEPLRDDPSAGVTAIDGAGMLPGIAIEGGIVRALALVRALLEHGYVALAGSAPDLGAAVTLTPPMTLTDAQIDHFAATARTVFRAVRP
ncbi:MAG: aspartate aminotransferase family protein [Deltaproteobacteria bacterium]